MESLFEKAIQSVTKNEKHSLTETQQAIYDFYIESYKANGFYPTIRETMEHLGFRSTNAVYEQLGKMERKGWLEKTQRARGIKLYRENEEGQMEFFLPRPIPNRSTKGLSSTQKKTYQFLVSYFEKHGISPSQREVCEYRGMATTNSVKEHYRQLSKKEFIRMVEGKARTIILLP